MKLIFKNPCDTCIVRVNCSQVCDDKKTYRKTLPKMSFMLSMCIFLTTVPSTYFMVVWVKDIHALLSIGVTLTFICVLCAVLSFAILKADRYMDRLKKKNLNEIHDIQSAVLRRKGIPIPPRCRRIP